jgi:hypothetical protein
MAICRQFADHHWEFADFTGSGVFESTDNLPIFGPAESQKSIDVLAQSIDPAAGIGGVESLLNHQIDSPNEQAQALLPKEKVWVPWQLLLPSPASDSMRLKYLDQSQFGRFVSMRAN